MSLTTYAGGAFLVAALGFVVANPLHAEPGDFRPDSVSIPLAVHHGGYLYDDFNEGFGSNLGVVLNWDVTETIGVSVGAYNNSYDQFSAAAYVEYKPFYGANWALGAFGGLATYSAADTPLDMPSRIGDSDFVGIGGIVAEYGNTFVQFTPAGQDKYIVAAGLKINF